MTWSANYSLVEESWGRFNPPSDIYPAKESVALLD